MAGAAGSVASGSSIASIGLQTYATTLKMQSDETQAQGVAQADTYQASRLDTAAQYGYLKATQTQGQMTQNLNTTLGNIDAVRAAAHTDPTSPTGAQVRNSVETLGNAKTAIATDSITAQAVQDTNDATYYRTASANALLAGGQAATADEVSGAAGIFGSVAKLATGGFSIPGFNPIAGVSGQ